MVAFLQVLPITRLSGACMVLCARVMQVADEGSRMQHYPTLTYSQFRVVESVPAKVRLPSEVDSLLAAPLPADYDFALEQKVIKDFEATQAASTKLTDEGARPATESTPPVPGAGNPPAKPPKPTSPTPGVVTSAVDDRRGKLLRMKELTNADDATCTFYLESWNWDLERAVQEFFSK